MAEVFLARGLSSVAVAISPTHLLGALPSAVPAPATAFERFRTCNANAVDEIEARGLFDAYAVPPKPVCKLQSAPLEPRLACESALGPYGCRRTPLLIIAGERDQTVPLSVARQNFELELKNPGLTQLFDMADRGHSLIVERGWREVALTALTFIQRFVRDGNAEDRLVDEAERESFPASDPPAY